MAPAGRADSWFEEVYASAADDPERIPWARLAPHPDLVGWLDRHPPATGTPALVVACGLGDDAAELARRGCAVEAFDLSSSAIAAARRRFPASAVRYRVADLFAPPAADALVEVGRRPSGDRVFLHLDYRRPQEREPRNSTPDPGRLRHA